MKLLLTIYSVAYIMLCFYWFVIGCRYCNMKGDFQLNFLGNVFVLQALLTSAVIIKYKWQSFLFVLAFPICFIIVIFTTMGLAVSFDLTDSKSLTLYAIINYPFLLLGSFVFSYKIKRKSRPKAISK